MDSLDCSVAGCVEPAVAQQVLVRLSDFRQRVLAVGAYCARHAVELALGEGRKEIVKTWAKSA